MTQRFPFMIPIGDWSDDGHGKMSRYYATAAKPIDAVREAYFAAKKKFPAACCPEGFCHAYEDYSVPKRTRDALAKAGAVVPEKMDTAAMAAIVVWFLNQGDPDLDVRLDGEAPPMLPFYGHDKKGRHIGHIGYGLLS